MAAMKAAYEAILDRLHALWVTLDGEGHHLAAEAKAVLDELRGDVPALEAEAKADAADVVHTAETQGLAQAEQQAAVTAARTPAAPPPGA